MPPENPPKFFTKPREETPLPTPPAAYDAALAMNERRTMALETIAECLKVIVAEGINTGRMLD